MHLTFNPKGHKYLINGLEVPSVSRVVGVILPHTQFNGDPELMERARLFGTAFHKMTALYDNGTLDEKALDPALAPYLERYQEFLRYAMPVFKDVEKPVGSERFMYAGTPDRVCEEITIKGRKLYGVVVDYKTGALRSHWTALQTMGYRLAWMEQHRQVLAGHRLGVYFRADGYDLEMYTDPGDEAVFLSGVSIYKYRKRNNLNGESDNAKENR